MKVFIIAALTADGFIGRDAGHMADWTSKEDKKLFVELTRRAGVMVMGGNTYRTIGHPLPGRRNIVYSRKPVTQEGIEVTQESPEELIKRLAQEGHQEIAICGGQNIYDMFLKAGLVDELFLSVEPVLFGQGLNLTRSALIRDLRLLETKKLNDNTVLMHYEVVK